MSDTMRDIKVTFHWTHKQVKVTEYIRPVYLAKDLHVIAIVAACRCLSIYFKIILYKHNLSFLMHSYGITTDTKIRDYSGHLPLLADNMSIIRPGVHTMISQPRFNSAICSDIPVPPYTHTAFSPRGLVNFLHSEVICMASSLVGVMMMAESACINVRIDDIKTTLLQYSRYQLKLIKKIKKTD